MMDNMMDHLQKQAEHMAREKILERTKQQQAYSTFSEDSSSGKWQLSRQASTLVSLAFMIMIIVALVVLYHFYFH